MRAEEPGCPHNPIRTAGLSNRLLTRELRSTIYPQRTWPVRLDVWLALLAIEHEVRADRAQLHFPLRASRCHRPAPERIHAIRHVRLTLRLIHIRVSRAMN